MKRNLFVLALVFALAAIGSTATAITVTIDGKTVFGDWRIARGRVSFDSSYPTGGETATATTLSDNLITQTYMVSISPRLGYICDYDYDNTKIVVYQSGAISAHTHTIAATLTTHTHTATSTTTAHTHTATATTTAHNHTATDAGHTHTYHGTITGHTHTITITDTSTGTAVKYNVGGFTVDTPSTDVTTGSSTDTFTGLTTDSGTASITTGTTAPTITVSNANATPTITTTVAAAATTIDRITGSSGSVSATALTEVANATNLTALTNVRYIIYGI